MTRYLIPPLAFLLASSTIARADEKAPVRVKLSVPKQLQLGKKGYKGKVTAEIVNDSEKTITVHHFEASSLVFEDEAGKLSIICHSCACMAWNDAGGAPVRPPFSLALKKGDSKTIKIDDWSCGGGAWPGPPAGAYRVTYRVFLEPPLHKETPKTCCAQMERPAFWKGAMSSPAAKLTIVGGGRKVR